MRLRVCHFGETIERLSRDIRREGKRMPVVRFAAVCDVCGMRQEEYAGYLTCDECQRIVCERCAVRWDPDPPGAALCRECAAGGAE